MIEEMHNILISRVKTLSDQRESIFSMEKQVSFSVIQKISELESIVGRLSPVQKMLLGTDGSVTSLLEILTGSSVEIETLVQRIIPANQAVAKELNVNPGKDVNYRVVKLKKAGTGETLIYAVSHTPPKRLDASFRDDLTRADVPIGVILKKHKIESRREINSAWFLQADRELSQIFNIFPRALMASRRWIFSRSTAQCLQPKFMNSSTRYL
jgi:beta-ribofuranosylaminobenzene 5'-phosphate synthase